MAKKVRELNFEDALAELEEIVNEMEDSDPALEELTKKYSRGIELSQICMKALDDAEAAMDSIIKDNSEGYTEETLSIC